MKLRLTVFLLCVTSLALSQPKLYIIRHAEKLANWPEDKHGPYQPLSETGVATANRLAKHFETTKFAAIYSSPTTRTLHTAFPVSQKLGQPTEAVRALADTSALDAFIADLSKKFKADQSILLVSHSNIIPYLLMKAGMPRDCLDEMGIIRSMGSSWLVTEGYDSIYIIEQLGNTKGKCGGVTRAKF